MVYGRVGPPGAVLETTRKVPTRVPVLSMAQLDKLINPAGLEVNDLQAPTSNGENVADVTVITVPATYGAADNANAGGLAGVNPTGSSAKSPVDPVTRKVYTLPTVALAASVNEAAACLHDPTVVIVHVGAAE
jgi:hypothetical protein